MGHQGLQTNFAQYDGEFFSSYKYICPKQLEVKIEHQGGHVTFLDLDITTEDKIFV